MVKNFASKKIISNFDETLKIVPTQKKSGKNSTYRRKVSDNSQIFMVGLPCAEKYC